MTADKVFEVIVWLALGGLVGTLGTIAAYKARLTLLEHKAERHEAAMREVNETLESLSRRFERRQIVQLQILANIAQKLGVEHRFDDVITRFLAEDD